MKTPDPYTDVQLRKLLSTISSSLSEYKIKAAPWSDLALLNSHYDISIMLFRAYRTPPASSAAISSKVELLIFATLFYASMQAPLVPNCLENSEFERSI